MGYGIGHQESYYYLAYSAMRNLEDTSHYRVNVLVNEPDYGYATGAGDYSANATAKVEAVVNSCYRFSHWTIDGVVVSKDNPYIFTVTQNVDLVAHLDALDFDTYSPTLWNNTFMLNLRKLREEGYEVTGCKWFKNGKELTETNTINEFSYSAGPNSGDLLELSPTYYTFELLTTNFGSLCSTKKILTRNNTDKLIVYPNPTTGELTIENGQLTIDNVEIFDVYGRKCQVINSPPLMEGWQPKADGVVVDLSHLQAGIYFVRSNDKVAKIVVIK
jgi:hypothetical protein